MIDRIVNYFAHLKEFSTFPGTVKNGIVWLFASWIWFYGVYFLFFPSGSLPPRQLFSGVLTCLIILTLRNWARVLCVLANTMVMFQLLLAGIGFWGSANPTLGLLTGTAAVLFGVSSYFLLSGKSAAFFRSVSARDDGQTPGPQQQPTDKPR